MSDVLGFVITLPTMPVRSTDHVVLTLELENRSESTVFVNSRFAVAPVIGDIRPEVICDGAEVPFKFRVRLAPIRISDFIELKEGERLSAGFVLSKGFDLSQAGDYDIRAEYVSEEVPEALRGQPVYVGTVSAAPARLTVR